MHCVYRVFQTVVVMAWQDGEIPTVAERLSCGGGAFHVAELIRVRVEGEAYDEEAAQKRLSAVCSMEWDIDSVKSFFDFPLQDPEWDIENGYPVEMEPEFIPTLEERRSYFLRMYDYLKDILSESE